MCICENISAISSNFRNCDHLGREAHGLEVQPALPDRVPLRRQFKQFNDTRVHPGSPNHHHGALPAWVKTKHVSVAERLCGVVIRAAQFEAQLVIAYVQQEDRFGMQPLAFGFSNSQKGFLDEGRISLPSLSDRCPNQRTAQVASVLQQCVSLNAEPLITHQAWRPGDRPNQFSGCRKVREALTVAHIKAVIVVDMQTIRHGEFPGTLPSPSHSEEEGVFGRPYGNTPGIRLDHEDAVPVCCNTQIGHPGEESIIADLVFGFGYPVTRNSNTIRSPPGPIAGNQAE